MQSENTDGSAEAEQITATVPVSAVVKALKLNDTNGADDRVIAVPQRDGTEANIRRAFQGTERYSNPSTAPVHIRPESLVERGFKRPPRKHQVRDFIRDEHNAPEHVEQWGDELMQKYDETHDAQLEYWEKDVRRMIAGEHELGVLKGVEITLIGQSDDD